MKTHAYWLNAPGPEMMSGVELHYVCTDELTPDGAPFWLPSIDWWPSVVRFWAGDEGFCGMTHKLVHANFEDIEIHESMLDAVRAWKQENRNGKKSRRN